MTPEKQKTIEFQEKRLRQIKWAVFGGTSVLISLIIAFNFFFFDMPLYKGVVNGLLGIGIAYFVVVVAFGYVGRLRVQLFQVLESQKAAENELVLRGMALEAVANAIVITDSNGRITWTNPAFTQLTGYLPEEIRGQNPRILKSGYHDDAFYSQMWQTILAGRVWQGEIVNRHKDGSLYTEEQTITPVLDEQGLVNQFIAIKHDVTRRKTMHVAEREQRVLAEALREAGLALSATLDLEAVLDVLVEQIGRVVPFDTASLLRVVNGRAIVTHTKVTEPLPPNFVNPDGMVFELAETPNLLQLVLSRQPFVVSETEKYLGWHRGDVGMHIRSWIGAPIIVEDEIFALLSLDKVEPGFYQPKHARMLSAFAVQASLVVHNARLFAEKEENLRREQQINQVVQATNASLDLPHVLKQVVGLVANLVEADGTIMALVSADGQMMTYPYIINLPDDFEWKPVSRGSGLAWQVVETRQSIVLDNYPDHPDALPEWVKVGLHALLAVPIVAGHDCLGALCLFFSSPGKVFSERGKVLAELVGRQTGVAIQNARLFEEAQQRARELDLLNRIIAATAVSDNEMEILQIGCTELARYFGVPQVVCALLCESKDGICIVAEELADGLPSLINRHIPVKGNPILQHFFDTAVPITLPDVRQMPLPPEMAAILTEREMVSVLIVPIPVRDQIVGAIGVHSQQPQEFNDNDMRLTVTIGEEIGQTLEKVRLNERLRTHTADLEQRVSERTQELAAANERLQQLDHLKSKFVSDVSHELRTPITNLTMYLDLLEQGRAEKKAHYVTILKKETARIRQLVEDILDLSRLDAGWEQGMMLVPVDLNQIVTQVITTQMPQIAAAGLELTFAPDGSLPLVWGISSQLTQVVTNLLTNAANYTAEGSIAVKTFFKNGEACLSVQDTGMGIDPADMPYIFDRFYRGQQVAQLGVPGTGLGLGIVNEIVKLHGGRVEATSEMGVGSMFHVWLRPVPAEA